MKTGILPCQVYLDKSHATATASLFFAAPWVQFVSECSQNLVGSFTTACGSLRVKISNTQLDATRELSRLPLRSETGTSPGFRETPHQLPPRPPHANMMFSPQSVHTDESIPVARFSSCRAPFSQGPGPGVPAATSQSY